MHKTMIGAAAGLALLVSALLSWDANATTLTGFGTLSSLGASPVQTMACSCGRRYRCGCGYIWRRSATSTCSMFRVSERILLHSQPLSLAKMEHDMQVAPARHLGRDRSMVRGTKRG
jgi:hypothetical protein